MNHHRLVLRASSLLLLGATINIGVAWILSLRGGFGFLGDMTPSVVSNTTWIGPIGRNWPSSADECRGFHSMGFHIVWQESRGPETADSSINPTLYRLAQWRVGWPLPSLSWEHRGTLEDPRGTIGGTFGDPIGLWRNGFEIPNRLKPWEGPESEYLRRLPLRPLPIGFLCNTLLYSAALAAPLLGCSALRSAYRRLRNLCPSCAYPLTGEHVCPECGKQTTKRSTESLARNVA